MLNTCSTTANQIQKHCLNTSPAKMSFRFPQGKRFDQSNPECPVVFYTYSSQLSQKKAAIGTSKKGGFDGVVAQTPAVTDYNPNRYNQFTKQQGKSFGTSLQKNPTYLVPQIHFHPSPASYSTQKHKKLSASFTMRPKTIDVIQKNKSYKKNPGPGEYQNTPNLLGDKKDILISRFKGPKLGAFNKSSRFITIKDSPGAQDYKKIDELSPEGKYVVSTHQGRGTRTFTQEQRFRHQHWKVAANPGPADYTKFSDFGIYGNLYLKSHDSNFI